MLLVLRRRKTLGVATLGFSAFLLATLSAPSEPIEHSASLGSAISTGLRYLRYSRDYWWLLVLGGLFGFSASALRSMLPSLTSDQHADAYSGVTCGPHLRDLSVSK